MPNIGIFANGPRAMRRFAILALASLLALLTNCAGNSAWIKSDMATMKAARPIPQTDTGTRAPGPVSAREQSGWRLSFGDDFDSPMIDESKWLIVKAIDDKRYHEANVSLRDGRLVLAVDRTDHGVQAARIDSRNTFSQQYGVFECRARIAPTEDTIFAFWMSNYPGVGHVGDGGRDGAEIDIIETGYRSDSVIQTLHWDGYGKDHRQASTGKLKVPFGIHAGWHVYGLEWDEARCRFFVDGVQTAEYSGPGVPRVPEFLILSSEIGEHWEGAIANARFPVEYEVDWVRAFTKGR